MTNLWLSLSCVMKWNWHVMLISAGKSVRIWSPIILIWKYTSERGKQLLALIDSMTSAFVFYPRSDLTWVEDIKDSATWTSGDSVVNPGMSHECEQEQSDMQIDPPSDADYEPSDVFVETDDESLFLKNVALFYWNCKQSYCCHPLSFKQLSKIFRK